MLAVNLSTLSLCVDTLRGVPRRYAAGPRLAVAAPDMRELVLRATCARPSAEDAIPTAQRMYVALQDRGDVRLAISLGVDLDA